MWKKSEESPAARTPSPAPVVEPVRSGPIATLGPSIVIKGDLTGKEDLVIEGRVEGEIRLTKNSVTVGRNGRVRADIRGKRVQVEGEVRGNLYGEDEVVIRASGRVQGNLISPRVTLENGSKFKGSIDMEPAKKAQHKPESDKVPAPKPEQKSLGGSAPPSVSPDSVKPSPS